MDSAQAKKRVALLSVLSNTALVILKIVVGLLIGSVSVLSEAIHSGVDLLAALIAYFAVRKSAQPPDEDHPFGHGKFENISGAIEALLIFLAAGWIIIESVEKLLHPTPLEGLSWGVAVMAFSAASNTLVSHFLFKVGRATDSQALLADAWHLRTDVYTSLGVMGALAVITGGHWLWPELDLSWVDPLGAILVALLILKAAYELSVEALRDLADSALPKDEEEQIRQAILSFAPIPHGFHHLRTRKSGAQRFIEFHVTVAGEMTVAEGHRFSHALSRAIGARLAHANVVIHIEPCDRHCRSHCRQGCLVPERQHDENA